MAESIEIEIMTTLIQGQKEYIRLLSDEIGGLTGMAAAHGWKSSRVGEGVKFRKSINQLTKFLAAHRKIQKENL